MQGTTLEVPQISAVQKLQFGGSTEIQRIKWNILGTCFATSSQNGEVHVWQRNYTSALSSLEMDNHFAMAEELGEFEYFKELLHFKTK